jgi:hypothetical protein
MSTISRHSESAARQFHRQSSLIVPGRYFSSGCRLVSIVPAPSSFFSKQRCFSFGRRPRPTLPWTQQHDRICAPVITGGLAKTRSRSYTWPREGPRGFAKRRSAWRENRLASRGGADTPPTEDSPSYETDEATNSSQPLVFVDEAPSPLKPVVGSRGASRRCASPPPPTASYRAPTRSTGSL